MIYPLSDYQKKVKCYWPKEARDFTPWLSNNLNVLNDYLGLHLTLINTEAPTGKYYTDILAKDGRTGDLVIIENQFGKSNHDHLGKCLTYQAIHKAKIVIWIGDTFTVEHLKTIDYLNEITPDDVFYYALSVQVFEIKGDWYYQILQGVPDNTIGLYGKSNKAENRNYYFWTNFVKKLKTPELIDKFQPWTRSYHDVHIKETPFNIGVSVARNTTSVYLWMYRHEEYRSEIRKLIDSEEFSQLGIPLEFKLGDRNSDWCYWQIQHSKLSAEWAATRLESLYVFFLENLDR